MAKGRTKQDPLARRAGETIWEWRSRLARHEETRRRQGEDCI